MSNYNFWLKYPVANIKNQESNFGSFQPQVGTWEAKTQQNLAKWRRREGPQEASSWQGGNWVMMTCYIGKLCPKETPKSDYI